MPFVPDNQLYPDQARHDEVMTFLRTFRNEWSTTMATLDESINRNFTDWGNELQGFQKTIDNLTAENADLRSQLQPLVDQIASAQTRLDDKSTELEANDPAPEPDPQPAGDEPA